MIWGKTHYFWKHPYWDKVSINWCRISKPSTVLFPLENEGTCPTLKPKSQHIPQDGTFTRVINWSYNNPYINGQKQMGFTGVISPL